MCVAGASVLLAYVLVAWCCCYLLCAFSQAYDTDIELDTPNLIRKNGYPGESHVALTEDGYLLTLHRIPHGRGQADSGNRTVVFLQHGLLSSSADWVVMGPNISLAYILADEGYDVWMGNVRGSTYSKGHVNLSSSDPLYWRFSWDEMAIYDLPASFDLVLSTTNQKQMFYIGHSMGTSMFFALASTRPDYTSARIRMMFAFAPVAFMRHIKSPIRILSNFAHDYQFLAHLLGADQFLPHNFILRLLARYGCDAVTTEKKICENTIFVLAGFDPDQFNTSRLPVLLGHSPAGTSARTIVHYAQLIQSGNFQPYDCQDGYGPCYQPPSGRYQLDNITVTVSLHYGDNDWLAGPQSTGRETWLQRGMRLVQEIAALVSGDDGCGGCQFVLVEQPAVPAATHCFVCETQHTHTYMH